jgi:hypothetical protein
MERNGREEKARRETDITGTADQHLWWPSGTLKFHRTHLKNVDFEYFIFFSTGNIVFRLASLNLF